MQEDLEQINQRLQELLGDLQRCAEKQLEEELKGALDPALLQRLFEGAGLDASALSNLRGKIPGIDPYRILGLDKTASDEEVKEAYRELLNIYHPDKSGTQKTKVAFQMVLAAFQLIKRERGLE